MALPTKTVAIQVADDYLELIKHLPLVPIKNGEHLKHAHEVIDDLSIIDEDRLTDGQREYLAVLSDLTTRYECPILEEMLEATTGRGLLVQMMDEHGLNIADIDHIIGKSGAAGKIINGQQSIDADCAKALGARFGLPAKAFLD